MYNNDNDDIKMKKEKWKEKFQTLLLIDKIDITFFLYILCKLIFL